MKTGTVPQSSENDILLLYTACVPCMVVGIKRKLTLIYCIMNIVLWSMNIICLSCKISI